MEQPDKEGSIGETNFGLMIDSVTNTEIIMFDRNGVIRSLNRGAGNLKGHTGDEVIGQSVTTSYTDEDCQSGLAQRELDTAAAQGRFEFEGWRVRKPRPPPC